MIVASLFRFLPAEKIKSEMAVCDLGIFGQNRPKNPSQSFTILHMRAENWKGCIDFFEKVPKKAKNPTRTLHFLHICIFD
jgi:hypothetical protein